ncbi:hypothetical protein [Metabacillus fastidiosus]|uniref:hypothetical protein n=1 Tax=Metabacillus fastidiosus TaxID=1458 RepID=UPI003D2A89D7
MIEAYYRNRVAEDIMSRAVTLLVNDTTSIPIASKKRDGQRVTIICSDVKGGGVINTIALLDEQGKVITKRGVNILPAFEQLLEFSFEINVRGA